MAFECAMADGADGVELDVRLTLDGIPVVCHDPDLARVTAGRNSARIAEMTAAELGHIELDQGARIPTLRDVLQWASRATALLDIELKADDGHPLRLARAVAETCRREHPKDGPRLVLSSFHVGVLLALKAIGKPGELALLTAGRGLLQRFVPTVSILGISGYFPEISLLFHKGQLERPRGEGGFVGTWTVNSETESTRATELGADVLIGDDPALLRKLVG